VGATSERTTERPDHRPTEPPDDRTTGTIEPPDDRTAERPDRRTTGSFDHDQRSHRTGRRLALIPDVLEK